MRTLDLVEWNFIEPRPAAFDNCETAVAHDLAIARGDGNFATRAMVSGRVRSNHGELKREVRT
jgi:hypothetical protein